jgi:hypothetical protein
VTAGALGGANEKAAVPFETAALAFGGESGMFFQFDKTSFSVNNLAQKAGLLMKKTDTCSVPHSPPTYNPPVRSYS